MINAIFAYFYSLGDSLLGIFALIWVMAIFLGFLYIFTRD
jgi:hypothetical protein